MIEMFATMPASSGRSNGRTGEDLSVEIIPAPSVGEGSPVAFTLAPAQIPACGEAVVQPRPASARDDRGAEAALLLRTVSPPQRPPEAPGNPSRHDDSPTRSSHPSIPFGAQTSVDDAVSAEEPGAARPVADAASLETPPGRPDSAAGARALAEAQLRAPTPVPASRGPAIFDAAAKEAAAPAPEGRPSPTATDASPSSASDAAPPPPRAQRRASGDDVASAAGSDGGEGVARPDDRQRARAAETSGVRLDPAPGPAQPPRTVPASLAAPDRPDVALPEPEAAASGRDAGSRPSPATGHVHMADDASFPLSATMRAPTQAGAGPLREGPVPSPDAAEGGFVDDGDVARRPEVVAATGPSSQGAAPSGAVAAAPGFRPVAEEAAMRIASAAADARGGTVELRLDPPELGHVRLSLATTDGTALALVVAERPETADLLRRHAEVLARELAAAGHGRVDVEVSTGGRGDRTGRPPSGRGEATGADPRPAAATFATAAPTPLRLGAGLDLRL